MTFLVGIGLLLLALFLIAAFRRFHAGRWLAAIVFFSSMVCLCVGLLEVAKQQDSLWKASADWKQTEATVLNSARRTTTEKVGEQRTKRHSFYIRYQYTLDGTLYESERYTLSTYKSSKASIDALVQTYAHGSQIEVLYDPNEPSQATVTRGERSPKGFIQLFAIGPGLIALLTGVGMTRKLITAANGT